MPDWLYNLRRNATDSIRSELETEHAGLLLTNQEILFIDEAGIQRAPLLEVAKVGRSGQELVVNSPSKELIRGKIELDKESIAGFFKKAQEVTLESRKRAEENLRRAQQAARVEAEQARLEAEAKAKEEAEAQAIAQQAKFGRAPGIAVGPRPEELLARGEKVSTKKVEIAPTVGFDDFPVQNAIQEQEAQPLFDYAPLGLRFAALIIDGIVVGAFNRATANLFQSGDEASVSASGLVTLAVTVGYYVIMESSALQGTLGKHLLGLAIVDTKHQRAHFGRALLRYIVKAFAPIAAVLVVLLAILPTMIVAAQTFDPDRYQAAAGMIWVVIGVGFIATIVPYFAAFFTPGRRALHDLIAGTIVVRR
jgi:uncharacterized RDD family membrane protein YckC